MKNSIAIVILSLLAVHVTTAQFNVNVSPQVKAKGNTITKQKGSSNDASIAGDYRENGTGWIFLPDHTGAAFVKNIQKNELIWNLEDINGIPGIKIINFKKAPATQNKLQIESQVNFLVNRISSAEIEFINPITLQKITLQKNHSKEGVNYDKTPKINTAESFSTFAKKYSSQRVLNWKKKGEFEKTADWIARVNDEKIKQFTAELHEEAIDAYVEKHKIKLGFCYPNASLSLEKYDADKEIFTIKSKDFGDLQIPVPLSEAEKFKNLDWCSDYAAPTNITYFIKDDKLGLAEATFWNKYKYENPLAQHLQKTKKTLKRKFDAAENLDNTVYNTAGLEKKPEFPGGMESFYNFFSENFQRPQEISLKGKIYVTFVVEKDGSLTDIKILRDLGHKTGIETVRTLSMSPKWLPGIINDKPVRVLYSMPISIQSD